MYALTLAGIPISIGANEAVHQQRLLDEEAESDERQEEFYLDVFCDAKSRKRDEVHGAIVVLKDGKVYAYNYLSMYYADKSIDTTLAQRRRHRIAQARSE
jgi:hypothetical protein